MIPNFIKERVFLDDYLPVIEISTGNYFDSFLEAANHHKLELKDYLKFEAGFRVATKAEVKKAKEQISKAKINGTVKSFIHDFDKKGQWLHRYVFYGMYIDYCWSIKICPKQKQDFYRELDEFGVRKRRVASGNELLIDN